MAMTSLSAALSRPVAVLLLAGVAAHVGASAVPAYAQRVQATQQATQQAAPRAEPGLLPAGFGSLRRDEVAIVVHVQGLTVRATPLDEGVLRTLAPDSYQALHAIRESRNAQVEAVRRRLGLATVQLWHVAYFNVQQGEARYEPRGMQVRSAGRDFRPLDVLALVPGFEDGRLAQGRTVDAIFVFDAAVELTQPLVITLAGTQSLVWADVMPRLERERAAIWSRAAAARKPSP